MYLLSADGMTVPALARHFDRCEATMRRWIRQFEEEGLKAVRHRQLGTGPDHARRREVRRALNGLLSRKRTWTAAQLAAALAEEKGIVMRPPTVRKYLHLMGASYRRTKYSLRHRQDPERAAAARADLDDFKEKPAPGPSTSSSWTKPASALSPCLPPTHTWCRRRPEVPHESPQRRRGERAGGPGGPRSRPQGRKRKKPKKKRRRRPRPGGRPAAPGRARTWSISCNTPCRRTAASTRGGHGQRLLPTAERRCGTPCRTCRNRISICTTCPHGPELNDIERLFRKAKHEAMPQRLQPHERALLAAVHACFRDLRDQLSS